jgi:outer membrane protein, heavy metal efflux system
MHSARLRLSRVRYPQFLVFAAMVLVGPSSRAEPLSSLSQAIALASKHAPLAIEASGQAAVARASMSGARVLPIGNPQLELVAGQQRTAQAELDAKLYLPLEVSGQRSARIEEVDRLVAWREIAADEVRARVSGDVTAAWGMAVVSAARIEQSRLAAEDARREFEWVSARQALGAATIADVSLADAEVARWEQVGAEAAVSLRQATARLAQLVRLPDVELPQTKAIDPPVLRWTLEAGSAAQPLDRAPALRSLAAEASYWRANAGRYQREAKPPVSVVVSAGRGDLGEPRVAGGLAWAIPTFRRNQGEIGRANAEAARADAVLAAARDGLSTRVRGDLRAFVAASEAISQLERKGLPASERLVEAATASWHAGKSELVQVIIARRDLASARLRRLDLVETTWRIYGELVALTGDLP